MSTLGNLIKNAMLAADPTVTEPSMVESFAEAIAGAITTYIAANVKATIPPAAIVTTGSATTQTGPAAPVLLTLTAP